MNEPSVIKRYSVKLLMVACIIVIVLADQYTKHLVQTAIPLGEQLTIIPKWVNITHVRNPGAAFGVMSGLDFPGKRVLLISVTVIAIVILAGFLFRADQTHRVLISGFTLVLAGAIGNLIDRIFRDGVIDFIEVYYNTFVWPSFNIADSSISVGIGLLILDMIFHGSSNRSKSQEASLG